MFVVTNRSIDSGARGLKQFGKIPNENGPHELRLVEAKRRGKGWNIDVLPDRLTRAQKEEIGLPVSKRAYSSSYGAHMILKRVRKEKKNVLVFVHGFNNDLKAVLDRAEGFEKLYNVEVLAFSWPADGGGVKGVASYKSDKRDARASAGAVYRTLAIARRYLNAFNGQLLNEVHTKAIEKFPDNREERQQYITRMAEKGCPFKINLMLHSMGNYLFKQIQKSSVFDEHHMLFDNVILAAADTNNENHAEWVDRIKCRRRTYIVINEDDGALRASRIKSGEEQLARLGHYLHGLDSRQALYVDVTDAPNVGGSHAYFEGDPVKNKRGRSYRFWRSALNGERAEQHLEYHPASNTWRP